MDFASSHVFSTGIVDEILFRSLVCSENHRTICKIDSVYSAMLTDYIRAEIIKFIEDTDLFEGEVEIVFEDLDLSPYKVYQEKMEQKRRAIIDRIIKSPISGYLLKENYQKIEL